jgi:hypothetical protein
LWLLQAAEVVEEDPRAKAEVDNQLAVVEMEGVAKATKDRMDI